MGDVVGLVEKAAEAVDLDDAKRMEEKMRKGLFTLEDFLDQLRQVRKMGSLSQLMDMMPGMKGRLPANAAPGLTVLIDGALAAQAPDLETIVTPMPNAVGK